MTLLQELAERTVALFPEFDVCVIRLHDVDKGMLPLVAAASRDPRQQSALIMDLERLVPLRSSISGRAIQTKQPVLTRDVQRDPNFFRDRLAKARGLHGMAVVPIPPPGADGDALGCVAVYSTSAESPFDSAHVRLLDDIARFVSVVLTNLDQSQRLALQQDVLNACRSGARERRALDQVCQIVTANTNATGALLYLVDSDGLRKRGESGLIPQGHGDESHSLDTSVFRQVVETGRTMRILDPSSAEELQPYEATFAGGRSTESLLIVPIVAIDTVVGILSPLAEPDIRFTHLDQAVAEKIAGDLGDAIAVEDERQARLDALTRQMLEPIQAIEEIAGAWSKQPIPSRDHLLEDIRTISMHCKWAMRSLAEVKASQQNHSRSEVGRGSP